MQLSRKSELKQLQSKAQEVTVRKQSSSSLFLEAQTSLRTWNSSTKSERRTKDSLLKTPQKVMQKKPKTSDQFQSSGLTEQWSTHFTSLKMPPKLLIIVQLQKSRAYLYSSLLKKSTQLFRQKGNGGCAHNFFWKSLNNIFICKRDFKCDQTRWMISLRLE